MDALKNLRVAAALVPLALAIDARAQSTTLASLASDGTQANSFSENPAISADGRVVAFQSGATNLVAGDTNGFRDVFVRDLATGVTTRVSVASDGSQGNNHSHEPTLSADGRFVAFESLASNLVAGDTNAQFDCFVHDRATGATTRVSLIDGGGEAAGPSQFASISGDGRWVAFTSLAPCVPSDFNLVNDVYVHDRQTLRTYRASESTSGNQGNDHASRPTLSYDGRFVAFSSGATNLVLPDFNAREDVFVRDLLLLQTTRVSVDSAALESNGHSSGARISGDGRVVAFKSVATNLVAGDTNGQDDVFAHDRSSGSTTRVSVGPAGAQGNGPSALDSRTAISGDGRTIGFMTLATNLVAGSSSLFQVCVHDLATGQTSFASVNGAGQPASGQAARPSISGDGRVVVFTSTATNLVAGDANATDDVFLRDRGFPGPIASCFGDGTGAACPCGNSGGAGRGCENSFATGGARLVASGFASVAFDAFLLSADGLPPTTSTLYFQGTTLLASGTGAAFGDGLRCAGGAVIRLGTEFASGGTPSHGAPTGDTPISAHGGAVAGATFHYQVWYRNSAAFCTAETFNLTNAVTATWGP